jgi:amino acid adenylation domain-containing protein
MTSKVLEEWTGGPAIVNAYGPTENSVVATASMKVDRNGVLVDSNRSSIGKATGCRTWIVDPQNVNKLAAVGAIGELVLEGRTVARGYLGNPEKTAEVFIQNPDWQEDAHLRDIFSRSDRMYRTGDLVRYNSDGSINYISRIDAQVKVNGQRLEIGEIEYHCCRAGLPSGTQAAVSLVVPPDRKHIKTLAVYLDLPNADSVEDRSNLRKADGSPADELLLSMTDDTIGVAKALESFLSSAVPSYMVPHLFLPVSKLPWSSSGKLDRNRLRNLVQELSKETVKMYRLAGLSKRAAVSGATEKLQKMWEEVLSATAGSVGADENFFRLGGDSLAAMKLAGLARSQGIALTFENIFKHPVLKDMANACGISQSDDQMESKPFSLLQGSPVPVIDEVSELCLLETDMIQDIYPPSPLQEGLIALSHSQTGAYFTRNVYRLSREIDISKFKDSWQTAFNELDILRTRIVHTASSGFLQVVSKPCPINWIFAADLNAVLLETTHLPKHNGGPLINFILVEDDVRRRYFVLCIHHSLYDGWTMPLMLKKVEGLYFDAPSSSPVVPFARFIRHLATSNSEKSHIFWRSRLAEFSGINFPQAPHDRREAVSKTRTIRSRADIPTMAGRDVTVPTLIRATWALVLASHTGVDDVCFGETLTGRNISVDGIAEMAGPCLATVPIRLSIERELTVSAFLHKIHQSGADIAPHQHIGLQHIRTLSEDTKVACDFQNLVAIQTVEEGVDEDLWDLLDQDDAQNFFTYPLVLECNVSRSAVDFCVHYSENAISGWHVERLMHQVGCVFEQLAADSGEMMSLRDVEALSRQDKDIITNWNRQTPAVRDECIHDAFFAAASSQPSASAVCDQNTELSYEELSSYAYTLSLELVKSGVAPEVLVPICVDKTVWSVVSLLAVLAAGGAFVPLDPTWPPARHREAVQKSGAKIVIVSRNFAERFDGLVEFVLSVDKAIPRGRFPDPLPRRAGPTNAAYGIFSSGSGGALHLAVIQHRSFSSSSAAFSPKLSLHSNSRVLQFSPLSCDVAVSEILTTLVLGGCVCLPGEEETLQDIAGAISRMRITWAALAPSVAKSIQPDSVPSLETLVCTGEPLFSEVASRWRDKVKLINAYGLSEASGYAVVNPGISTAPGLVPIGFPIPATLTWILDSTNHDKLAPLGAIGELALEGPTLAREYFGDPQRTDEAFVTCPAWGSQFPNCPPGGRRIYKTGDLVKYDASGALHFVGRKDCQVRLRAHRTELGEIEYRLYDDPKNRVQHAIVLMPERGPSKNQLVCVLMVRDFSAKSPGQPEDRLQIVNSGPQLPDLRSELNGMRDRLSDQLPEFMIPRLWLVVEALPSDARGSLDKKLVAEWVEAMDDATYRQLMKEQQGQTLMATRTTKIIQEICSVVLNSPIEQVEPNQSFLSLGECFCRFPLAVFDLFLTPHIGGDSITAMMVTSRCRKEGIKVSMQDVLRCKSLSQLAECAGIVSTAIQPKVVIGEPFELSPVQQLYFQLSPRHGGQARFNQSHSLRITRPASDDVLRRAVRRIIEQHPMLRARFARNRNGFWKQQITDVSCPHAVSKCFY